MQAIKVRGHVGDDGILKLEVPFGAVNQDVEAVIVVQVMKKPSIETDANGYPIGFFEETYGSLADDPIERPPQGEFEIRESLD
jgi:hypothetical protein